jgi:hypothetical protein
MEHLIEHKQVGTAGCAVPARAQADGTSVVSRTILVLRLSRFAARTAQRAVPTLVFVLKP